MCNKEKYWSALARELGHPEWSADADFANFAARLKNRDRVTQLLDQALMADTTAAWIARPAGKVPVAPVFDVAQALDSPFVAERGGVQDFRYPDGRAARLMTNPIRVDGVTLPQRAAPRMGEDNVALLRGARFDDAAIAKLQELGAITAA